MTTITAHAGARLDRLPISGFHHRILALVGAGMFLDGFEVYLSAGVLGALVRSGMSTMALNAQFISVTLTGMVLGSWLAGIAGDRYGRRFSYQVNLLIFGLASLAGAAAPSMGWLIVARFFMGIGLAAETVVGYATLIEYFPPAERGRWGAALCTAMNASLPAATLLGYFLIPTIGWRPMFVIVGVGALIVWYLRKAMPESPRWLESKGRLAEAEAVLRDIESEVAQTRTLPPPAEIVAAPQQQRSFMVLFSRPLIRRTVLGCIMNIAMNMAVYAFILWIPTFLVKQGMSVASSLGFSALMAMGGPAGGLIGMWLAERIGRKRGVILFSLVAVVLGSAYPYAPSVELLTVIGFALVTVIYILVALAWASYLPELFPTDVRLRGTGLCNTVGRVVTMVTPYMVVPIYAALGVAGVVGLLSGILVVQALAVAILGIETKRRSLEALAPAEEPEAAAGLVLPATTGVP